ncbi:hypothetical protein [Phenylobacterium immobile]|uniref:hypothetical protein n=1 Tax=Phenylobacterium immobile TaxID=21 RepID=UPI00114753D9|nr:hypothetical protein [Phenylobacterium immobile]
MGDTDMTTFGLVAAASGDRQLALGALTSEELQLGERGLDGFCSRASASFGVKFRPVRVKRYEGGLAPAGASFAEFQRVFKPGDAVFACQSCGGDAVVQNREAADEFQEAGGIVNLLGDVAFTADH